MDFTSDGIVIRVRLTPNSCCDSVKGVQNDGNDGAVLRVSVTEVPEKGKANQAMIKFLAKALKTAKGNVQIISGQSDRNKKVFLRGLSPESRKRLEQWFQQENEE